MWMKKSFQVCVGVCGGCTSSMGTFAGGSEIKKGPGYVYGSSLLFSRDETRSSRNETAP
jgi:hypothetical protein